MYACAQIFRTSAPPVIVSDEAYPSFTAASCNRKTWCVTLNLKLYQRPRWERGDKGTQGGRHHSEAQSKSFFLTSLMHRPSCWTHFWAGLIWGWALMEDQIRVTRRKTRRGERPLCDFIDKFPTAPAPAATTRGESVFLRLKMIVFSRFICWTSFQLVGFIGHVAEFVVPSWCCTALRLSLQVDDT